MHGRPEQWWCRECLWNPAADAMFDVYTQLRGHWRTQHAIEDVAIDDER